MRSVFWDDLARDVQDPAFAQQYVVEALRVATIDRIMNSLDDARVSAGLSKAALARAIGADAATVRRLFSASGVNPTLGTLAEIATALGLRITLEPLLDAEHKATTNAPSSTSSAARRKDRNPAPRAVTAK